MSEASSRKQILAALHRERAQLRERAKELERIMSTYKAHAADEVLRKHLRDTQDRLTEVQHQIERNRIKAAR